MKASTESAIPGREHPPLTSVCVTPTGAPDRPLRMLCILSELLGNAAFSSRVRSALDRVEAVEPTYLALRAEDYRAYRAPRWRTVSDPLHVQWVVQEKLQHEIQGSFDALFINGWDLAVGLRSLVKVLPTALAMDVVPSLAGKLIIAERSAGPLHRIRRQLADQVHHRAFDRLTPYIDAYLPMSTWCADALRDDYGVPPDRCRVTLIPQDLESWSPGRRSRGEPFQLLFVANDFSRKGGDLLLKVVEKGMPGSYRLVIASNDPALEERSWPEGVKWIRGLQREQMLEVYRRSDLLVLPSRRDMLPQVLAEAMAVGLPCVATDVGGVRELVKDGLTGILLPYSAGAEEWAEAISCLMENEEARARLSKNARAFAEEHLGMPLFQRLIAGIVEQLRQASAKNRGRGSRSTPMAEF